MPRAKKPKPLVESPRLPREFSESNLRSAHVAHARSAGLGLWTEESIVAARDAQVRGQFRSPARLLRSILTEPSIYAAGLNRLAPHRGLPRDIVAPCELGGNAATALHEARATFATDSSVSMPPATIADGFESLAFHGLAVEQIYWEPRADGSRLDAFVMTWSLEDVEWDAAQRKLFAITTEGRVEIVHGDGRWIVSGKHASEPWKWGAIVALAKLWSAMAFGRRDQSSSASSHGDDKWIGTMPEGIPLDSPEATAMLSEMEKLYESRRAMLKPFGSEIVRSEAMAQNWQIFKELLDSGNKDAQRILLGQDGTMTNSGGNYVKSWGLFGVRNDIIESDVTTRGAAYSTGLLRPWSIINFGRWDRLRYAWLMPDADEDARRESHAARVRSFNEIVRDTRVNGFVVDQAFVNELAKQLGIVAPTLADAAPSGAEIFAYHIDSGIVLVDEVRARLGYAPLPNGAGQKTIPQAQADAAAASDGPPRVTAHREPLRPAA